MKKDNKIININEYKLKKEELDKATYSSIITEIVGGLKGDKDEDISYLEFQMEKYRSHEFGIEIIKECIGKNKLDINNENNKRYIDG